MLWFQRHVCPPSTTNATQRTHLLRGVPAAAPEEDLLAQNGEVRLVRGERQHDEVRVQPVQDVPRVGVVAGLWWWWWWCVVRSDPIESKPSQPPHPIDLNDHLTCARSFRMKSMILCSPSPGSLPSLKSTLTFCHALLVLTRCAT
jgi:hypothetical protein